MLALSDSSVISASSASTSSPSETAISMIGTASESPRSGTTMSTVRVPPEAAFGAAAASFGACCSDASCLGASSFGASCSSEASEEVSPPPSASSSRMSSPSETVSPSLTRIFTTLPPFGAGTSMLALSDSRVIMVSSAEMTSPTATGISMISTSELPPMSGTLMISLLKIVLLPKRARGATPESPAHHHDVEEGVPLACSAISAQTFSGFGLLGSMP